MQRTELPIACSLSAPELAERTALIERLTGEALAKAPLSAGVRITFPATAPLEAALRALAAAEARCCPFLAFEIARAGDELRLDVTGPAEARPVLDELLA